MSPAAVKQPADRRPSLNRKVTPKSEANRQAELDSGVKFTIDDEVYEIRIGEVTSTMAREIRAVTGQSFQRLLHQIALDPDIDIIATFVWIARRIKGEDVELDAVSISYSSFLDDKFEIDVAGPAEVDASPEA